jgi:hypothetical protein
MLELLQESKSHRVCETVSPHTTALLLEVALQVV